MQACSAGAEGDTRPDPRLDELVQLVVAVRDEWEWAHDRWPARYPSPERYLERMRAAVREGRLDDALADARRDYRALVWPCVPPPEAGVDEHGRPLPKRVDREEPAP